MQPQVPNAKPEMSAKEKVLAAYSVKLGIKMPTEEEINKEFNPTLDALNKKIKSLSTNLEQINPLFSPSKLTILTRGIGDLFKGGEDAKKGILGLTDALGEKMGLGKAWASNTSSMLNYAMMSKNVKDANKELYESMGPLGKAVVSVLSKFGNNKKMFDDINGKAGEKSKSQSADEKRIEQTKNSIQSLRDLIEETIERKNALLEDSLKPGEPGANHPKNALGKATDMEKEGVVPPEQIAASTNSMNKLAEASETAGEEGVKSLAAVGMKAIIATGGILLIVGAVVALGAAFYKAISIVVSLRMEMKKFDQVFMGVGEESLKNFQGELFKLNDGVKDLGISMEKVNGIVLAAISSGVTAARAMSSSLNRDVQELSGVTGVEAGQISSFFDELIKKIRISDASIHNIGNTLTGFNQKVDQFKDLGHISFQGFTEAINTSSTALLIAQHNGDQFAKDMIADLATMTSMATTFGMSVSELNGKFEESGSLISSATSGFRDLLVISGGANMNNLMTDQFNKTESMLKMATYLQDLNKKFGNNINLTAQVAAQAFGLSKDAALQLLNITESEKSHLREMKQLLTTLDEDNVSKAYQKVTHTIVDAWEKVKASAMNVFERVIGGSQGMGRLQTTLTNIVEKLQAFINGPTFLKIVNVFDNMFDSIGGWLSDIVDNLGHLMDDIQGNGKGFWGSVGDALLTVFDPIVQLLISAAQKMGEVFASGAMNFLTMGFSGWWYDLWASKDDGANKPSSDTSALAIKNSPVIQSLNNSNKQDQAALDGMNSVGAKGSDLAFGKDSNGNVGFMTVAEKQYLLQKEIDDNNKKKEAEEKKLQEKRDKVQEEIRDAVTGRTKAQNEGHTGGGGVSDYADKSKYEAGGHALYATP